jgi:ketosteroid isomerase-like protein
LAVMTEESTNSDLVELARQAFESASRHDVDAVMRFYAADALLDTPTAGLGTYEGAAAIREFVESWWATFEDHTIEQEESVNLGHGVLFSQIREAGRLAGSDGRVQQQRGWVTVWVGSKVVHHAVYDHPDEGRAAAERLAHERG